MTRRSTTPKTIAVLDFETDPFDHIQQGKVYPFVGVLYVSEAETFVFQNENSRELMDGMMEFLDKYPKPLLIYAHNGGRFDYRLMLWHVLGRVICKPGRIMKFHKGKHEFRDSLCLIPTALDQLHKEVFDYTKLSKDRRKNHMPEIIDYCKSDCRYLHAALLIAHEKWGRKLTIGEVAKFQIRTSYPEVFGMSETMDEKLRPYFRGGRVECLAGVGVFKGDYACYDFNSSYPYVMSRYKHPIGKTWLDYHVRTATPQGLAVTADTVFLDLTCRSNGAFIYRDKNGLIQCPRDAELRLYTTTIHEYDVARRYDLIRDATIHRCVDCPKQTDFSAYIDITYRARCVTKTLLAALQKEGLEKTWAYVSTKIEDTLIKLLLNNSFGKFAQDPRRQREFLFLPCGTLPPEPANGEKNWSLNAVFYEEWNLMVPSGVAIYDRAPKYFTFNNIAAAASITGAARARLLEALQFAIDPVYCDTDNIICRGFRADAPFNFDESELGALKLEWRASEVGIAGKKLYYYCLASASNGLAATPGKVVIKAKGANTFMLSHDDMIALIEKGASVLNTSRGPCIKLNGMQNYIVRTLRATGRSRSDVAADAAAWSHLAEETRPCP